MPMETERVRALDLVEGDSVLTDEWADVVILIKGNTRRVFLKRGDRLLLIGFHLEADEDDDDDDTSGVEELNPSVVRKSQRPKHAAG